MTRRDLESMAWSWLAHLDGHVNVWIAMAAFCAMGSRSELEDLLWTFDTAAGAIGTRCAPAAAAPGNAPAMISTPPAPVRAPRSRRWRGYGRTGTQAKWWPLYARFGAT